MSALPKSIRKAAVLISALDERAADAVLDQMGSELAAKVRNALLELDEIPADEQQSVLAEFLESQKPQPAAADVFSSGVELALSDDSPRPGTLVAKRLGADSPHADAPEQRTLPTMAIAAPRRRFDFLADVPPAAIIAVLSPEQPQIIAVIVAELAPELAGELLSLLTPATATEVLERMAWLGQLAEEVLDEIELHLRTSLAPQLASGPRRDQSLARLNAVLAAMDVPARERMLGSLRTRNKLLARQLGFTGRPLASAARFDAAADDATSRRQAIEEYIPVNGVRQFRYRLARSEA